MSAFGTMVNHTLTAFVAQHVLRIGCIHNDYDIFAVFLLSVYEIEDQPTAEAVAQADLVVICKFCMMCSGWMYGIGLVVSVLNRAQAGHVQTHARLCSPHNCAALD